MLCPKLKEKEPKLSKKILKVFQMMLRKKKSNLDLVKVVIDDKINEEKEHPDAVMVDKIDDNTDVEEEEVEKIKSDEVQNDIESKPLDIHEAPDAAEESVEHESKINKSSKFDNEVDPDQDHPSPVLSLASAYSPISTVTPYPAATVTTPACDSTLPPRQTISWPESAMRSQASCVDKSCDKAG